MENRVQLSEETIKRLLTPFNDSVSNYKLPMPGIDIVITVDTSAIGIGCGEIIVPLIIPLMPNFTLSLGAFEVRGGLLYFRVLRIGSIGGPFMNKTSPIQGFGVKYLIESISAKNVRVKYMDGWVEVDLMAIISERVPAIGFLRLSSLAVDKGLEITFDA
ncbi:MAG: hypothetical protein HZA04_05175 [Nitrospinae bacterium]|nr:hypothetical protein [Nitrospinota bacterium]